MKKELPINIQHRINNQLCNAGFLCILLAYENMENWLYEHYIQLYYSFNKCVLSSKQKEMFLDFYGGWTEPREMLCIDSYNRKDVEKFDVNSFIKIINENKYVYCYVDEYYIQISRHNSHDILVYGYNDEKQTFQVVGYKDRFFQQYEVDYNNFIKAFYSGIKISKMFDTYHGINYFLCIKPCIDRISNYKFHIEKFEERLYEYINCINTGILNACDDLNHKMYQKEGNVYGLKVYECLISDIEMCKKKLTLLDYRAFHTLYEHNMLMRERLEILPFEINEELKKKIDELVSISNKIRMLVMKYDLEPNLEVLERIISETRRLYEAEKESYTFFYEYIYQAKLCQV